MFAALAASGTILFAIIFGFIAIVALIAFVAVFGLVAVYYQAIKSIYVAIKYRNKPREYDCHSHDEW